MKIKKITAIILSVVFMLSLAGCGEKDDGAAENNNNQTLDRPTPRDGEGLETNDSDNMDIMGEPEETAPEGFTVTGRYDLTVPADVTTNPNLWCWVSDEMDDIFNGKDPAEFQKANYLVIECGGEINTDALASLAWMSSGKKWDWNEFRDGNTVTGFNLGSYIIDGNIIALPLADLLDEYTDYKFSDLDTENVIKIYFRYGDEKNDDEVDFLENLDIQAVYFASSVSN